jgi:hypothetical protein
MKFIEIEGYQVAHEFFMKELIILDSQSTLEPIYYIFKPLFPESNLTAVQYPCVQYATSHIHKLHWSEGITHYCVSCITKTIVEKFGLNCTYYCMGEQKSEMLSKIFPKLDIQPYSSSITFKELPPLSKHIRCLHRDHGEHCALRKVYRMMLHHNRQQQ